jgi:hypothetical protein
MNSTQETALRQRLAEAASFVAFEGTFAPSASER